MDSTSTMSCDVPSVMSHNGETIYRHLSLTPHSIELKRLCKKGLRGVRDGYEPSLTPH